MVNTKNNIEQWGPLDSVILYMSFWYYPTGPGVTKAYGISWPELIAYFRQNRITFWWEHGSMQKNGEKAIRLWLLQKAKLTRLKKDYEKIVKELFSLQQKVESLTQNSRKGQIRNLVSKTYELITDFWKVSLVFEVANFASPNFLRTKLFGKIPETEISTALEILLAPTRLSFHQQEELELLQTYVKSGSFESHAKKWYWVENSYYECKYIKPQDFKARLQGTSIAQAKKKITSILSYSKQVLKKKEKLVAKYKLPKELQNLAALLSFSIWWQDDRKGKIWIANTITEKLARHSSSVFNITFKNILLYNAEEFVRLHKTGKKLSKKELENRFSSTIVNISPKKHSMISGAKATTLVAPYLKAGGEKSETKFLQGIVVSQKGTIVKGKVRILLTPRNGSAMKNGEILVAPMTSPDYVPYMRKAKAIITDVGGLMSHAAVVSREMGKPCIVNTKFATKLLKDGDLVEVDASKGVVKKL